LTKVEIDWLNKNANLIDLVSRYYGVNLQVGFTVVCPFHNDTRKSAKTFSDTSLYCFTERKVYRPYDVLKQLGWTDERIRDTYHIPTDLKPMEAWSPPEEYKQAVLLLRKEHRPVEEIMRLWEYVVWNMKQKGAPDVKGA
jgi:hypothetical protein